MLPRAGFAVLLACSPIFLHAQEATASLTGSLQCCDGAKLAASYAILESTAGAAYQTKADEQGIFRFSEVRAGSYTLSFRALGVYTVKVKMLDLLASEEKSLPPLRFGLAPAGDCVPIDTEPERSRFLSAGPSLGGLTGNLASGSGPAAGVRVSLGCWMGNQCGANLRVTMTDAQGDFAFENLRPGRYTVSAGTLGFFPFSVRVDIAGGLESSYSFALTPCPNGDCTVKQDPNIKLIVCE